MWLTTINCCTLTFAKNGRKQNTTQTILWNYDPKKEIIREASFDLNFKLDTKYKNKEHEFISNIIRHLMNSSDDKAWWFLKTIKSRTTESNMVTFGKWSIIVNDRVMDRPNREAIRIIDEIESENQCLFDKWPQHHTIIDREDRSLFSYELKAASLKCALGFNMHRTRNYYINKKYDWFIMLKMQWDWRLEPRIQAQMHGT